MNFAVNLDSPTFNRTPKFIRLVEHVRQCLRQRAEMPHRQVKSYSAVHYIEHIKRRMNENPSVARALFRFYNTVRNFSPQMNRMHRHFGTERLLCYH